MPKKSQKTTILSSVQFDRSVMSNSLWPHGLQHARPPCPTPTPQNPRVYQLPEFTQTDVHWVGDAIQPSHPLSSSVILPFSCLQSFPASGSFLMSQFFASGGQSIGVSASTSVLPMNIQDLFPLGWSCWISVQSKGLSKLFSNTTVQKYPFLGTQLSL